MPTYAGNRSSGPTTDRMARALYYAIKDIGGIQATVSGRLQELGKELAQGEDRMEVASFTVNGQTFTGETTTRWELLEVLSSVDRWLTNGYITDQRQTRVSFW